MSMGGFDSLNALTGGPQRQWDAMAMVEAPLLEGDAVHFVALADGSIVTEEQVTEGAVDPLADALEEQLAAPYRAEAARDGDRWTVTANSIEVLELADDIAGDSVELVRRGGDRQLTVDGEPSTAGVPDLEAHADARASEYIARAERIDADLWEVQISPF